MYKKWILTIALLIFSFGMVAQAKGEYSQADEVVTQKIFVLMSGLEGIITKGSAQDKTISERFFFIKRKLQNHEMNLALDHTMSRSIIGGMAFGYDTRINSKELPHISISPYMFDLHKRHPSVVYSMLIYEIQHAYNYFKNHNHFVSIRKNKLERFYYDMDALYLEALFVKKYLLSQDYKVTPFENFLVHSMENNHLNSISAVFKKADLELSHKMDDVSELKGSLSEKMDALALIGSNILNDSHINPDTSDRNVRWVNYLMMVQVYTYKQFVPQVAYDIANSYNNELAPKDFSFDNYPKLKKTVLKVNAFLKRIRDT